MKLSHLGCWNLVHWRSDPDTIPYLSTPAAPTPLRVMPGRMRWRSLVPMAVKPNTALPIMLTSVTSILVEVTNRLDRSVHVDAQLVWRDGRQIVQVRISSPELEDA